MLYVQQFNSNTGTENNDGYLLTLDGIKADRVYVCCLPDWSLPPGNT